jgi:hypothetical protein
VRQGMDPGWFKVSRKQTEDGNLLLCEATDGSTKKRTVSFTGTYNPRGPGFLTLYGCKAISQPLCKLLQLIC